MTSMLSKPPSPTYAQFVSALFSFELRLQNYNSDDRPIDPNVFFVGQRSNKNNGRNFNRNQQFNSRGRGFTPSGQTGVNSNSQKNLQRQQNSQVPYQQPQHRPPQSEPQQASPSKCCVIRLGTKVLVTDLRVSDLWSFWAYCAALLEPVLLLLSFPRYPSSIGGYVSL